MTADLFYQHVATPSLLLIVQIILIWLNKHTCEEEEADNMSLFKCIIWIIPIIAIFPAQLAASLLVTNQFTFAYVSLGLLFLQIIMNIEIMIRIMKEMETGKKNKRNR